jgi:hypothetical protein
MKNKSANDRFWLIFSGILTLILIMEAATSCRQPKHFISDSGYRQLVHQQFQKRMAVAAGRHKPSLKSLVSLSHWRKRRP